MNNTRIQARDLRQGQFEVLSFGSSFSLHTFDPEAVQNRLQMSAYNCGSHQTDIAHGMVAQFDNAHCFQKPSIVILCVTPEDIESHSKIEPLETYTRVAPYIVFPAGLKYYITSSMDQGALSRAFLWKAHLNKLKTIKSVKDEIIRNYHDKRSADYRSYSIDWYNQNLEKLELKYRLKSCGYMAMLQQEDFYDEEQEYSDNIDSKWKYDTIAPDQMDKPTIEAILYMSKICRKDNIQLVVSASPMAPLYIKGHSTYWDANDKLQTLIESNGGIYINMNLIKPQVWRPGLSDFWDEQHLVEHSAYDYTYLLCDLVDKKLHGEDISPLFFSNFEDWTNSYPY